MISIRRIHRSAAAVLAVVVTPLVACAPAAFATQVPPPGMGDPETQVVPSLGHAVRLGGMPGWQITLIAVGAALIAAALAVLLDRMWTARHGRLTTGAS
jgi:hypothetical protein